MKRKQIVAGNWKMNKTYEEGQALASEIAAKINAASPLVILGTPFIHLKNVSDIIRTVPNMKLAAQNCHQEERGAFTGEISSDMLKSVGVDYVIIGHSERREYFNESDELLAKKVRTVLAKGMIPIFCCGEKLEIREAGKQKAFVEAQITRGLFHLNASEFGHIVIAYEPIWAIGTGKTASKEQAQDMHQHIRHLISQKYGQEVGDATSILYGGSCKPSNASELFSQADVDGGLIGGASLTARDFVAITNSF